MIRQAADEDFGVFVLLIAGRIVDGRSERLVQAVVVRDRTGRTAVGVSGRVGCTAVHDR